ncbi:Major facilitator superfamily domain general substrate transporter [Penicillium cf. griseofulvum]|uniref:Major facilitator superfamily domain general substrate transporter n=1 Tax=Penicillium cf. griseofulvum TaxID=2972120 RepID=A0A9W9LX85_9EURO|nr:Major facilitator superfamily domain general substrate transporter [Penicillium cf. griseofulvum]KAJ5442983.1 Major facilitator superfamily domain general substrate transporter [Penicillium cf. griseofulvum]KAJ5451639.1 Major facilitator superfamily domain general substrate transporter [Penicillium cf. griseofulvum]
MEKISSDPQQEILSDAPDEGGSPSRPPASTWKVVSLTIALCLGIFCMSLDITIITTTIPRITDEVDSLHDVSWYGSSFLLTTCATTLAFGKFYTLFSTKWVYLSALFLFEVGSLVCGATPTSLGLILGRCIAGVGAGGIFSGSLLMIAQTVPLHQRPIFTSLLGSMYGIASVAGPPPRIIVLFVLSGVLLIAFAAVQIHQNEKATLPPRIICNRNIWSSAGFAITLNGAYFVLIYYLPIWFQTIKAASATKSGIMNLPSIITIITLAILSGTLVTIFGYYNPIMIMASVIASVGAGRLTTLSVDSGSGEWIGYQILFGIGIGLGMLQPFMVVQNVLHDEDVPTGTAVATFAQTLGGAIFISVGQNVSQNEFAQAMHLEDPAMGIAEVLAAGTTTLRKNLPAEQLPAVLRAYNTAITHAFYVGVALAALSLLGTIALEWKSVNRARDTTPPTPNDHEAS